MWRSWQPIQDIGLEVGTSCHKFLERTTKGAEFMNTADQRGQSVQRSIISESGAEELRRHYGSNILSTYMRLALVVCESVLLFLVCAPPMCAQDGAGTEQTNARGRSTSALAP